MLGESRQSPQRTTPTSTIGAGAMPDLQPIVKRLDESIRATIPGLDYAVKWKRPYYGLPQLGWIIEIAAYDVSVNVLFFGGADFESLPRSERPTGPGTSRSPASRRRSDRSCINGSSKRDAHLVGCDGHRARLMCCEST